MDTPKHLNNWTHNLDHTEKLGKYLIVHNWAFKSYILLDMYFKNTS